MSRLHLSSRLVWCATALVLAWMATSTYAANSVPVTPTSSCIVEYSVRPADDAEKKEYEHLLAKTPNAIRPQNLKVGRLTYSYVEGAAKKTLWQIRLLNWEERTVPTGSGVLAAKMSDNKVLCVVARAGEDVQVRVFAMDRDEPVELAEGGYIRSRPEDPLRVSSAVIDLLLGQVWVVTTLGSHVSLPHGLSVVARPATEKDVVVGYAKIDLLAKNRKPAWDCYIMTLVPSATRQ